jgi:hypothetical protein
MCTVDADDAVATVTNFDSRQHDTAGARDRHGVVTTAVDDSVPHAPKLQAVQLDDDRTGTCSSERDHPVLLVRTVNSIGQRPPAAIENRVRSCGRNRGGEKAGKQKHHRRVSHG